MWNRLAVVASVLAMVILPIWGVVDQNKHALDTANLDYDICMRSPQQAYTSVNVLTRKLEARPCLSVFDNPPGMADWSSWGVGLAFSAAFCALAYALIWVVVAIGKWVWRGRSLPQPQSIPEI